jgi:hypothetical protein
LYNAKFAPAWNTPPIGVSAPIMPKRTGFVLS